MEMRNFDSRNIFKTDRVNICILGGGNIGTLLAGDFSALDNVSVRLYTSRPDRWNNTVSVYSSDEKLIKTGKIDKISDNPAEVISDAHIIISTLPSHVLPREIKIIEDYVMDGAWIGVMPGSGGAEFYCRHIVDRGCVFFGFQRVHGIARVKEYGRSVYDLGRKNELHIAVIPGQKGEAVRDALEKLFGVKCHLLPNYLNVTLTPSNPILHTTRLYSMFRDYREGIYWNENIRFYEEWTDDSSEILFACDAELQELCRKLNGLDLSGVRSLREHYESEKPGDLTSKIRSIKAFRGILSPMKQTEKGYIPDFDSRYFLEDFPFGLCIIKGFCDITGIDTPSIDKVLMWYEKISGARYYVNGKFEGKDLEKLPLPQNNGLHDVNDVIDFYSR